MNYARGIYHNVVSLSGSVGGMATTGIVANPNNGFGAFSQGFFYTNGYDPNTAAHLEGAGILGSLANGGFFNFAFNGVDYTLQTSLNGVKSSPISTPATFTPVNGAVPEPATWALMILGFGAAGAMLRRRRFAFAH